MADGRAKPLSLVKGHRTKAEKNVRAAGEAASVTGTKMLEWETVKNIPEAHKQFRRMKMLYGKIGKDDAVYEASINRYCLIHSELMTFEARMQYINEKFETACDNDLFPAEDAPKMILDFAIAISKMETNVMSRRKMLLDIEKESALTLASVLRSIPKKPAVTQKSAMAAMLEKRTAK